MREHAFLPALLALLLAACASASSAPSLSAPMTQQPSAKAAGLESSPISATPSPDMLTATPIPPTPTETLSPTDTATATETLVPAPVLNPAEMQTDTGVHGVDFEFTGQYQGITQNVAIGVVPSMVESISPNGIKLNENQYSASLPDRLAEASIRAWHAAYLDRNGLTESQYSLSQYITDFKNGKDLSVDEWVYDPATKTSSVVKLGPNTHLTLVSADQLKWYPPPQIISNNFGISMIKDGANGLIVIEENMNFSRDYTTEQRKLGTIDINTINLFLWLKTRLEVQQDKIHLSDYVENSPGLVKKLVGLLHPSTTNIFSSAGAP